ncbi:MAG: MoxR family ATPase [Bifidobacteriaceae bacterium]|jgi:MoxR-like ATPase|nr:MoxR family ATPase [Bifidobacteriaceae bacterium]
MDNRQADDFAREFAAVGAAVAGVIVGKRRAVALVATALLAGGHVLLEDVPGAGKTTLARALAAAVRGTRGRVQFTPDLLPSDLIGASVYDARSGQFAFRPGPVFCSVLLADEINLASPKTQSALLEVMEERQVTVDGVSHPAPRPFLVIATQNPVEQIGTYPLPEAQLDRFAIRARLGYPDHATAVRLVCEASRADRAADVEPVISTERVVELGQLASQAHIAPAVADYIVSLTEATRADRRCELGSSTRGGLVLARCAKVRAMARARPYVTPDDVQALAPAVLAHRLVLTPDARLDGVDADQVVVDALAGLPAPKLGEADLARAAV